LVVGAVVVPSFAQAATPIRGQTLMPGVIYSRQVEFTAHGPVVMHVIQAPRPSGLFALKPVLSNNAVLGTERVTSMQRRFSADAVHTRVGSADTGGERRRVRDPATVSRNDAQHAADVDCDRVFAGRQPADSRGRGGAGRPRRSGRISPGRGARRVEGHGPAHAHAGLDGRARGCRRRAGTRAWRE